MVSETLFPPAMTKALQRTVDLSIGIGGGPSFIADGEANPLCLSCGGRGPPGDGSVWDGAGPNSGAGDVIHATTCCGGEAPDGCLLARSPVLAGARENVIVLVEMRPSLLSPVPLPRRSWLAVPYLIRDTSGSATSWAPLPDVVPPSTWLRLLPSPPPSLVSDGACESPAVPLPYRGPLPWGRLAHDVAGQMFLQEGGGGDGGLGQSPTPPTSRESGAAR